MSRIIGLTGGIGSGKSTASRFLEKRCNFSVIDADALTWIAHKDAAAIGALIDAFGETVAPDGARVDRKALAKIAFSRPGAAERLNRIMLPVLERLLNAEIEKIKKEGDRHAVIDAALLYEARWDRYAERVLAVVAPAPVRLRRAIDRGGITPEQVRARMAAQISPGEMCRRADDIIYNVGSIGDLERQIARWASAVGGQPAMSNEQ